MRLAAVLIFALALGAYAWARWMATREAAIRACRRACAERELQLLDDTVCLRSAHLRLRGARAWIERVYGFEYSATGTDRHPGEVLAGGGLPARVIFVEPGAAPT